LTEHIDLKCELVHNLGRHLSAIPTEALPPQVIKVHHAGEGREHCEKIAQRNVLSTDGDAMKKAKAKTKVKAARRKVSPIPRGYHSVTPYLSVRGGAAAIESYKKAFGAKEIHAFAGGDFITQQRIAVLVGGTGTGKTHLAAASSSSTSSARSTSELQSS
jgi:IstB-like ATP binding protein